MSWWSKQSHKVRGFMGSSSGWEDSYFGGYEKILWDYPEIKIAFELQFENKGQPNGMSWYSYWQLIKIFLLKVKEFKLTQSMASDVTTEEIEIKPMYQYAGMAQAPKKKIRHTVTDAMVWTIINAVESNETELRNLFTHYKTTIQDTAFFYEEEPQDDQDEDDKNGKGSGGGGQGQGKSKPKNNPSQKLNEMLQETKKEKKQTYDYSWGRISSGEAKFRILSKGQKCNYTTNEILQAHHLYDMLDISFDPASDKIHSLRSGKLDPRKICEMPSGNFNIYSRVEENQITRPFSVCLLADESSSMDGSGMRMQASVFKILYRCFSEILPADKLFIYGHTSTGSCAADVRIYNDKYNDIFEETIQQMGHQSGGTPCPISIEAVYKRIRETTSDNIIFIYTCDGCPDGGEQAHIELKKIVEKCKRDGFVTVGVGILSEEVKHIYNYHTIVNHLDEMVRKVSLIVNHVVKTEFQS